MSSIGLALIVFACTLLVTKSKLFACKREYVEKRYQASKLNEGTPWLLMWVHKIWHAIFTCPMCSGAWWSFVVCSIWSVHGYAADIAISFGLNWLIHLVENLLFVMGEYFDIEHLLDSEKKSDNLLDSGKDQV